jgi:hypothetical protein
MRFTAALLASAVLFTAPAYSQERNSTPMPAAMIRAAADADTSTRKEFRAAMGHDAKSSQELFEYLDRHTGELPKLNDDEVDSLVQRYGSALGQALIRECGGKWVRYVSGDESEDGVELPNGKIAFVFNRAYKRIAQKDPIGFVTFYQSTLRLAKGLPLLPGVTNKRESEGA